MSEVVHTQQIDMVDDIFGIFPIRADYILNEDFSFQNQLLLDLFFQ